ncbi:MAG: hypothetical protein ACFCVF_13995 [Kineosporiaceae bacterium]
MRERDADDAGRSRNPGSGRPGSRHERDHYAKRMIDAGLGAVLTRLGLPFDAADLTARPTELPASAHRADLVYAASTGEVVHLEIQSRPDPAMGRRMAEYAIRLAGSARLAPITHLVQVVVQLDGPPMPTRYEIGGLVNRIHLWHVPSTPVGRLLADPVLAPLALLRGDRDLVAPVVDGIAAVRDPALQADLVLAAVALCPAGPLRATVLTHARRTLMSSFLEELVADLRGTYLGGDLIAEGERTGERRGEREGRRDILVRLVSRRFPDADPARVSRTVDRILDQPGVDPLDAVDALTAVDR